MTIDRNELNGAVILKLGGRLDTTTAAELEDAVNQCRDQVMHLTLDFTNLDYISSAGLRVILMTQKTMQARKADMRIVGVNESIMEVFEITGFTDILIIE